MGVPRLFQSGPQHALPHETDVCCISRLIGVGPRMLAAIQSLYASGTLAMKVGGTAGAPLAQQNGVRQGYPLSPTLFGIFFDGLHAHLDHTAPHAGVQLGSGRWVSSLVYADDVVLMSWSAVGLQQLLDGMHGFCQNLGLIIRPTKTEVVVFNGHSSDSACRRAHSAQICHLQAPGPCSMSLAACLMPWPGLLTMARRPWHT